MKQALHQIIERLSLRAAYAILIGLPALFLVFHALVLAGILPENIVWGGRLTDATFERLLTPVIALYALCHYRLIQFPEGFATTTQDTQ